MNRERGTEIRRCYATRRPTAGRITSERKAAPLTHLMAEGEALEKDRTAGQFTLLRLVFDTAALRFRTIMGNLE